MTEDNWDFIMRVNGLGVLICMQEAAKQMIAQGTGGKIINSSSIAGRQGYPDIAPYCGEQVLGDRFDPSWRPGVGRA